MSANSLRLRFYIGFVAALSLPCIGVILARSSQDAPATQLLATLLVFGALGALLAAHLAFTQLGASIKTITLALEHLGNGQFSSLAETMVVATAFPPDDSSTGYPRGTSVSKIWDKATTDAAIEVADYVVEHLDELTGARPAGERRRGRSPSDPSSLTRNLGTRNSEMPFTLSGAPAILAITM